jgi:hypothetical protein
MVEFYTYLGWGPTLAADTTPQVNLQSSVGAPTATVTVRGVPPPPNTRSAEVHGDAEAGKGPSFLNFGQSRMGGGFDAGASCVQAAVNCRLNRCGVYHWI